MKKEIPMLFSTPMVQALLAGNKTMTRRVMKSQPVEKGNGWWDWAGPRPKAKRATGSIASNRPPSEWSIFSCPYGRIGDLIWVRESFCYNDDDGYSSEFSYKSDYSESVKGWKPSIHMPKVAARIWLEITEITVERLQDISRDDAIAEGVDHVDLKELMYSGKNFIDKILWPPDHYSYGQHTFVALWCSINGPESWNSNPWVWVIKFKKVNKPNN